MSLLLKLKVQFANVGDDLRQGKPEI